MDDDVKKETENNEEFNKKNKNYKNEIILGYILSLLGGILGFIVGAHLVTRDDKRARKHGLVILIIAVFFLIGGIFIIGYNAGVSVGYDYGEKYGYDSGYKVGYNRGYDLGYIDGWNFDYYKGTGTITDGTKISSNPSYYNPYMEKDLYYYAGYPS